MANYPLGIENVFPVSACPPASYTYTYTYSYCLSGAWVLSHPLLSRQLPSNSSIPLYSQTTVNNYHALLSLLPVWSGAHTTWVSPLPFFSAHCAGALPALRSLRVGSQEWAVEGQGGKLFATHCWCLSHGEPSLKIRKKLNSWKDQERIQMVFHSIWGRPESFPVCVKALPKTLRLHLSFSRVNSCPTSHHPFYFCFKFSIIRIMWKIK